MLPVRNANRRMVTIIRPVPFSVTEMWNDGGSGRFVFFVFVRTPRVYDRNVRTATDGLAYIFRHWKIDEPSPLALEYNVYITDGSIRRRVLRPLSLNVFHQFNPILNERRKIQKS